MKTFEEIKQEILNRTKNVTDCSEIYRKIRDSETTETLLGLVKLNLEFLIGNKVINTCFLEEYFGTDVLKEYDIYVSGEHSIKTQGDIAYIYALGTSIINVETSGDAIFTIRTFDDSVAYVKTHYTSIVKVSAYDSSTAYVETFGRSKVDVDTWTRSYAEIDTYGNSKVNLDAFGSSSVTIETYDDSTTNIGTWSKTSVDVSVCENSIANINTHDKSNTNVSTFDNSSANIKVRMNSIVDIKSSTDSSKLIFNIESSNAIVRNHIDGKMYIKKGSFEVVEVK